MGRSSSVQVLLRIKNFVVENVLGLNIKNRLSLIKQKILKKSESVHTVGNNLFGSHQNLIKYSVLLYVKKRVHMKGFIKL